MSSQYDRTTVGNLLVGDIFKFSEGTGSGAVFLATHTNIPSTDHRTVVFCKAVVIRTGNSYTELLESVQHTESLCVIRIKI